MAIARANFRGGATGGWLPSSRPFVRNGPKVNGTSTSSALGGQVDSGAVQKHRGNLRGKSCYCEYGADCVQTMPAITQRGPICRKAFCCRCLHSDVDGIDGDGPHKQHPCKTQQTSQGECEYRAPSATKEGHHQGREECSSLDSSDPLPPVAIKRILHSNEERSWQGELSGP
jgi:hypothetical protein